MKSLVLIALGPMALVSSVLAEPMNPGMASMIMRASAPKASAKPAKPPRLKKAPHRSPRTGSAAAGSMPRMARSSEVPGAHDMGNMPGMKMGRVGGGVMSAMAMASTSAPDAMANMPGMKSMGASSAELRTGEGAVDGVEPEILRGQPPPPAPDHAADRYYDPGGMAVAREQLRKEHGGATASMVMANLAEYQSTPGGGGYRWEGEAWIGGDVDRLVIKSEGDGARRDGLGAAEAQALYSHAIGPYFDLQVGVRQDVSPHDRTYATIGFQGLAPYWTEISGALFLSTKGELLGRLESSYDLRLTQRWILEPRSELNFAAQSTRETKTGAGLTNAEVGLRLRYEIQPELAPYIGVSWDRKLGKSADYAKARGENFDGATLVAGVRAWF